MQYETERPDELTYRFKLTFPVAEVHSVVRQRLADLSKSAKVPGFRPGKVPMRLMQQKYGKEVWREAFEDKMSECCMQAIKESGIEPVTRPRVEGQPPGIDDAGDEFQFIAEVEVTPEFELTDFTTAEVEKPVVTVSKEDIDEMIERLRRQQATYSPVVRAATDGDRLTVALDDAADAKLFGAEPGESKQMMIATEKQAWTTPLVGVIAGDTCELDIPQPGQEDTGRIILPGQENTPSGRRVSVRVETVEECVLPELDAAFFKNYEASDMDEMRSKIEKGMQKEAASREKSLFRDAISRALLEQHQFALPAGLVKSQIDTIRRRTIERLGMDEEHVRDDELFREQAENNIKLGLIMDKIIKTHSDVIKVDHRSFEEKLRDIAGQYNESEEFIRHCRQDRKAHGQIEQMVLEDKLFAWLAEQVKINEKSISFDEVMSPPPGM